ncbi:defense against restriction DarA-related protein [Pseudomonas extremaustralis]
MGSNIQWNDQAMPKGQTLDQLLYRVRHNDTDGLMFDSVTMAEIMDGSEAIEPSVTFDAIISPFGRLARKVNSLMAVMNRSTPSLTVVANQVSAPFKQVGVANVVALFELSDGQTVSVYFHNPDATPGKILPTDEMISWKWLLNKKDITIVVAPERGTDLAVREVGRRIMKLASRNSAAFGRANAKRTERLQNITALNGEIVALEGQLQSLQSQIEIADIEAENAPEAIKAATSADGLAALDGFRQFLSRGQYRAIAEAMRGEEGAEFIDKAQILARIIDGMAKTYEQDGKGDQATAYLHYFKGGADWYITEKDASGKGTEQAFGSADLGQGAELGYISIDELARNNVELDLYFAPVTLASVSKAEVVAPAPLEPEDPPAGTQGDDTKSAAAVVAWGEEADVFGKTKPAFMGSSTPIPQALNVTQFGSWAFDRQSKMAYFVALDGSIVGGATAETPEAAFANMQVTPEWKALQASGKAKMLVPEGVINTVKTAKGTKVETGFTVVEADQLIASHDINGKVNPDYPQLFQPRDRSRDSSIQWVQKTAGNIDPDSLGRTQRADSGAPIVGPDRVVESGNGRTMALQEAYRSGNAEEYREWLIAEAGYFGLDAEHIKTMKAPVLVRVRTSMDIDRRMFAIEANQDDKLSLTGTEKAKADADRLDSALLNKLGDDGNLLAASNRDFVNGFLQSLGDTEAAQYMTSGGQPTGALIARIQAAIFAKAYNDDRLLELTADTSRPEVANVLEALNVSAPEFILAQAADADSAKGLTGKLVDSVVTSLNSQAVEAIIEATNLVRKARAEGTSVQEAISQLGLFGDIPPATAAMALFISENNRSAKRLGVAFKAMAEFVRKEAERGQTVDMFGESESATLHQIIEAANRKLDQEYGEGAYSIVTPDLFAISEEPASIAPAAPIDLAVAETTTIPEVSAVTEPEPPKADDLPAQEPVQESSSQAADRTFLESILNNTVPDILAPELGDQIGEVFERNAEDEQMLSLIEQAVTAYQRAMEQATASL